MKQKIFSFLIALMCCGNLLAQSSSDLEMMAAMENADKGELKLKSPARKIGNTKYGYIFEVSIYDTNGELISKNKRLECLSFASSFCYVVNIDGQDKLFEMEINGLARGVYHLDLLYKPEFVVTYKPDMSKADSYFKKAMLCSKKGNDDKAVEYLMKSAENGYPWGQYFMGMLYLQQGDPRAWDLFKKSADKGNACAQQVWATIIIEQQDTANYPKALSMLKKSASQRYVNGQVSLANLYYSGIAVEQDLGMALHYYELAAKQGHPEALIKVACLYLEGVKQNDPLVFRYLKKGISLAESMGEPELTELTEDKGYYCLGKCYVEGIGTEKNVEMGKHYLSKAKNQEAVEYLRNLGQ